MSFEQIEAARARHEATLRVASDSITSADAIADCLADVPVLIAEVERLAFAYADLVAACRAGLGWADENGDNPQWSDAWRFVIDELPPAPQGHPLSRPFPLTGHEAAPSEESGDIPGGGSGGGAC